MMLKSSLSAHARTLTFKLSADGEEVCEFPLPPRTHQRTSSSPSGSTIVAGSLPRQSQDHCSVESGTLPGHDKEVKAQPYSDKSTILSHHRPGKDFDIDTLLLTEQIDCLKVELEQEKQARADETERLRKAIGQVYHDFNSLARQEKASLLGIENKVETLITGYCNFQQEVQSLRRKFDSTVEAASQNGFPVDEADRCTTPVLYKEDIYSDPFQASDEDHQQGLIPLWGGPWTAQIVFVLDADWPNKRDVDGVAYLEIQSRRPSHKVCFPDDSNITFIASVHGAFHSLLQNHTWMPLACSRAMESHCSNEALRITLDLLPMHERSPETWTRQFLEENCIRYDTSGTAHIYVCLQEGKLSWGAIDALRDDAHQSAPPADSHSSPAMTGLHPQDTRADYRLNGVRASADRVRHYSSALDNPKRSEYRGTRRSVETSSGFAIQCTEKLPPLAQRMSSDAAQQSTTRGKKPHGPSRVEFSLQNPLSRNKSRLSDSNSWTRKEQSMLKLGKNNVWYSRSSIDSAGASEGGRDDSHSGGAKGAKGRSWFSRIRALGSN